MPALRRIPAALTVPVLAILTAGACAQEKKPPADRTANRGPDQVELNFKLPPPPVLSPAESLKAIRLQPGFRIECVASEPLIDSPIAMSWDTKGRLFVLEMRDYMNDVNGGGEDQPTGRVKRLEDADGDGIMDRASVRRPAADAPVRDGIPGWGHHRGAAESDFFP